MKPNKSHPIKILAWIKHNRLETIMEGIDDELDEEEERERTEATVALWLP